MITHQRLLELLHYNPETGLFTWKQNRGGKIKSGDQAGCNNSGYIQITVDYEKYAAHRLAWFYVHGVWPIAEVDHRDLVGSNNAIENLREATTAQNGQNKRRRAKENRTSKWKGVCYDPGRHGTRKKCWKMSIKVPGGKIIQRNYEDEREAAEEYMFLALEHHGEFARFD